MSQQFSNLRPGVRIVKNVEACHEFHLTTASLFHSILKVTYIRQMSLLPKIIGSHFISK